MNQEPPAVLNPVEAARVASQLGVGQQQVRRDHFISHVLGSIASRVDPAELVFIGGTALSRTHLPDVRLSEDVDFICRAARREIAEQIIAAVDRGLARTHLPTVWVPPLTETRSAEPAVLSSGELRIEIQLLDGRGYPPWPTEVVDLQQRYTDAPPARMRVPTIAAFVAMKAAAWLQRGTARDLYDLWALTERGHIGPEAISVFNQHGPSGSFQPDRLSQRHLQQTSGTWRSHTKRA